MTKWLSPEEAAHYEAIADSIDGTEVDTLLSVAGIVTSRIRQSKAEIKATETACEKMAADLPPEPMQSQLDDAEQKP